LLLVGLGPEFEVANDAEVLGAREHVQSASTMH
jgi:hypothetical protein